MDDAALLSLEQKILDLTKQDANFVSETGRSGQTNCGRPAHTPMRFHSNLDSRSSRGVRRGGDNGSGHSVCFSLVGLTRSGGQVLINSHGSTPLKDCYLVPLHIYRTRSSYQLYNKLNECLFTTQFRVIETWIDVTVVLTSII